MTTELEKAMLKAAPQLKEIAQAAAAENERAGHSIEALFKHMAKDAVRSYRLGLQFHALCMGYHLDLDVTEERPE